jgi:hypothetical protein
MLTLAYGSPPNYHRLAILHWTSAVEDIWHRRQKAEGDLVITAPPPDLYDFLQEEREGDPDISLPWTGKVESLLQGLTVADVENLAAEFLPDLVEIEQAAQGSRLIVFPGQQSFVISQAAPLLLLGMLIALLYLWIFLREATNLPGSPPTGTLLAVSCSDRLVSSGIRVILCAPAATSGMVALESFRASRVAIETSALAALILVVSVFVTMRLAKVEAPEEN